MGFVSIGTIVCGILTVVYAAPHFQWPYASCSGIWAGIVALLTGLFGLVAFMRFDSGHPHTKRWVVTFYAFVIANISCAGQHTVYSAVGLANCAAETDNCNLAHRDRLMQTELFATMFGAVVLIASIATTVYMGTRGRLHKLTGMPPSMVHGACCAGQCVCYSDVWTDDKSKS